MEENKKIKVGSDFSGVGAFDQALIRLGINHETLFACDMDKYARQTYILNYGEPKYYPDNVYDREIPKESLDIYMSSPPCQAFSLAGKRKGEEDKRGILFYNTHEFIQENRPRFFIIENVKGLLSDGGGKTFQRWIDLLGGKSVNGNPVIFPNEESTPYHVYYQVLNAKHYGVPQNRERIFIIGIRDYEDNNFFFPKPIPLEKRLKDVLESEVDEKYFLSDNALNHLINHKEKHNEKGTGFGVELKDEDSIASTLRANGALCPTDNHIKVSKEVRTEKSKLTRKETGTNNFRAKEIEFRKQDFMNTITTSLTNDHFILGYTRDEKGKVVKRHEKDLAGTLHTASGGGGNTDQFVVISTNNSKGYDIAEEEEEDSINFSVPTSETRRGRVGKKVSQTLDTQCNQGIATKKLSKQEAEWIKGGLQENQPKQTDGISPCLVSAMGMGGGHTPIHNYQQRIRRLTPLECFRLMDFNENFKWDVSDSQAYKQAGNSIVVNCLVEIIKKLNL